MQRTNTSYSVTELAKRVDGSVLGSGELSISGVCPFEVPRAGSLSFLRTKSLESLARQGVELPAMAVLVPQELLLAGAPETAAALIAVKDPYRSFLDLLPLFFAPSRPPSGIHPTAIIDPSASLGSHVSIGAYVLVGPGVSVGDRSVLHSHVRVHEGARIGSDVELFSGVVLRSGTLVGDRVIIHDNAVIGADGFGYIPDPSIGIRKVPQLGIVEIEDDVEIGANTCIDRGTIGSTKIGSGTKIDNLVQIGHNTVLGRGCLVCGQTGIAGSCTIGDGVILGGASGVADHCDIVSGVRLGGWCGVTSSITEPGDYLGFPAVKASEFRRQQVRLMRLTQDRGSKPRG